MEYGRLIRDAWAMAWRHKFLWLLGMFAPSSVGSCSGSSPSIPDLPSRDSGRPPLPSEFSDLGPAVRDATSWLGYNTGILIAIGIILVLVVLAFAVMSFIAQGAMVRATGDLGSGQESTLGRGLRAGLRHFWRFLGLWALTAVAVLALLMGLGLLVATGVAIAAVGGPAAATLIVVAGVLIAIPLVLAAIVFGIAVSIILGYARRAMVLDEVGIFGGIQRGFLLLRENLGQSLLAWLVSIGLSIGIVIVSFIIGIVAIALLALPAIVAMAVAGPSPAVFVYAAFAFLVFAIAAWVVGGAVNSLFWSYWTLVYLRLAGRPPAGSQPPGQPMEPAVGV